jgi:hypothetical protein
MQINNFDIPSLLRMRHSPVRNYVVPGLTSWLIGEPGRGTGTIRLFECEREQQESIAPHSHRFNFQCGVLAGRVTNRIWRTTYAHNQNADWYRQTKLSRASKELGWYEHQAAGLQGRWTYQDQVYTEGQCYGMQHDEVHSIFFSRGAKVLFFEGPELTSESIYLEPVVGGETIPTFKVEPWMFRKGDK